MFLKLQESQSRQRLPYILCMVGTWLVEFSQLYQADWTNDIRHLPLMGMLLGYGFRVEDLIAYTLGILAGLAVDLFLLRQPQ